MKTTIEIPEPLYKRAKIRAVERGESLRQLVLGALEHELESPAEQATKSFGSQRKLTSTYALCEKRGEYRAKPGKKTLSKLISEERDAR